MADYHRRSKANSQWDPTSEEPKQMDSVDVAIAVATDKGLITPILKQANTKALKEVSPFPVDKRMRPELAKLSQALSRSKQTSDCHLKSSVYNNFRKFRPIMYQLRIL